MRRSALAVLAVGAALAAPSGAQAAPAPTTVTINFFDQAAQDVFRGRVGSPRPACRGARLVRLFRMRPGADTLIDTDRSEDTGPWSIDVEGGAAPGRYYVRVAPNANCEGATSETVTVP